MPRLARTHAPGSAVHVISRFVNREFRLAGPMERHLFLGCLAAALLRSDWVLLAYALMSSHVHLAAIAGRSAPEHFLKSLHVRVAHALNAAHGRFGPVFAERATTITSPLDAIVRVVPYLHNNPARAGVVENASASDWTSHRAWIGTAPAPAWLHADLGLRLAGFDPSRAGRAAFDELVRAHQGDPRWTDHSPEAIADVRARIRRTVGAPVELASPIADRDETPTFGVLHGGSAIVRPPWPGEVGTIVDAVAHAVGMHPTEIRSPSKRPQVARARRLAALVGVRLGRPSREMAIELGRSTSSISELLSPSPRLDALEALAASLVAGLRGDE